MLDTSLFSVCGGGHSVGAFKTGGKICLVAEPAFQINIGQGIVCVHKQVCRIIQSQRIYIFGHGYIIIFFHTTRQVFVCLAADFDHCGDSGVKILYRFHLFICVRKPYRNVF